MADPIACEAVLRAHPDVADAAVLGAGVLEDGAVAVVVPVDYAAGPDLALHIAAELGPEAVPAAIALFPDIPRGEGGRPDVAGIRERLASWPAVYRFEAPRTDAERRLADLWCRVLERPWIGVHDDFIEAGGDSVTAAVIVTELAAELGSEVALGDLFELATIAELARRTAPGHG
ncbi:phosphopantetheine-binding protein [Actinomadura fibrosa]|uniref:Phosphopantetheine-binding protein n=1 Tax=Actinomadura fibrosa TaxID=111802 RepID=A0ABW2XIY4_9ACTN|nr:phosphopantetheine-binding protein [Actinomadura fibrosa]